MPIHDWTLVRANRFHDFHRTWTIEIRNALNAGLLPEGYFALAEQITSGPGPDVVTLSLHGRDSPGTAGGLALADAPVATRHQAQVRGEAIRYARKADRVVVHHPDGVVVAVVEIVSPGNKGSAHAARSFADKAARFLIAGVHLLVLDLFPPSRRDPRGIHTLIWDRIADEAFTPPADKPLTLAAYSSGEVIRAFVEPVGVGDRLPELPIFLEADRYVPCPLEATYRASWAVVPGVLKAPLEGGATP